MSLTRLLWLYFTATFIGNAHAFFLGPPHCTWRWRCAFPCHWTCCQYYHECLANTPQLITTRKQTSTTHQTSAISTSVSTTDTKGTNIRSKISTTFPSVDSTLMTGMPEKSKNQLKTTPLKTKHHNFSQTTKLNSFHSLTRKYTDRTSTTLAEKTKLNVYKIFSTKEATTSIHAMSSDPPKSTVKVATTSAKRVDNGAEICQCDISYLEKVEFWKSKNFTPKEMLDYMAPLMKTVLKELELNKTRLFTNKLKRTSAPDNRRSSKQIGVAAIAFIVGVVVLVIFIDVISVLRFFNILED